MFASLSQLSRKILQVEFGGLSKKLWRSERAG